MTTKKQSLRPEPRVDAKKAPHATRGGRPHTFTLSRHRSERPNGVFRSERNHPDVNPAPVHPILPTLLTREALVNSRLLLGCTGAVIVCYKLRSTSVFDHLELSTTIFSCSIYAAVTLVLCHIRMQYAAYSCKRMTSFRAYLANGLGSWGRAVDYMALPLHCTIF